MKPDLETSRILTEAEELMIGIKGNFWGIVKKRFVGKITALNDIMNIDITSPNLSQMVLVNQSVVKTLIEMIREIEGEAQSVQDYQKVFNEEKKEDYLQIIEG